MKITLDSSHSEISRGPSRVVAQPMRGKDSFRVFTGAYSVARSAGLLNTSWAKRAFVSSYFLYKRFWEDSYWGLVRREPSLFHNGAILDIGANVGYTSCVFANALEPGYKVYSFEPDQANFQMLSGVIRRKHFSDRIVPVNSAVGKSDGQIELWHNAKHSGDHRVVTDRFKGTLPERSQISAAALVSVDSFVELNKIGSISFIKIDVQGYELAVCEGMARTIQRFPGLCIGCEYSPESLAELGFDPIQLLNYFRTNGFQIHVLTRSSTESVPDNAIIQQVAEKAGYVDLVCSRAALPEVSHHG